MQLEQLQAELHTYRALGAEVLAIVAQRAEDVEEYRRSHQVTVPMLIDADREVIRRYGVYHRLGLTAFNIARPATFIIDRDGRIRFLYVGDDQRDRPDHAVLVSELEQVRT